MEKNTDDGKVKYAIEFRAPEWFRELNDDIQNIVYLNLQDIMHDRVSKFIYENNYSSNSIRNFNIKKR